MATVENGDERKLQIDCLLKLGDIYWRDFDTNRSYEWKVNFALWTSLAAFSGLLLRGDSEIPFYLKVVLTAGVAIIFLAYWLSWSRVMWQSNYDDVEHAYSDWNTARKLIGLNQRRAPLRGPTPGHLLDSLRMLGNWSRRFQLLVTLVLSAFALAPIWLLPQN